MKNESFINCLKAHESEIFMKSLKFMIVTKVKVFPYVWKLMTFYESESLIIKCCKPIIFLNLIYPRFRHKMLEDCDCLNNSEPMKDKHQT